MTTDPFDAPGFQAFCAHLGVQAKPVTDTFGRTDFRIDRAGMETIRDAARQHGFPDIAARVEELLTAGGRTAP
jgi:hypothetical protein